MLWAELLPFAPDFVGAFRPFPRAMSQQTTRAYAIRTIVTPDIELGCNAGEVVTATLQLLVHHSQTLFALSNCDMRPISETFECEVALLSLKYWTACSSVASMTVPAGNTCMHQAMQPPGGKILGEYIE